MGDPAYRPARDHRKLWPCSPAVSTSPTPLRQARPSWLAYSSPPPQITLHQSRRSIQQRKPPSRFPQSGSSVSEPMRNNDKHRWRSHPASTETRRALSQTSRLQEESMDIQIVRDTISKNEPEPSPLNSSATGSRPSSTSNKRSCDWQRAAC